MPKLIIQLMNEEWTADLQVGSNILGRATNCTVPLKDASLSRQHCDIVFVGGTATVVDKGSMNGTLVNGRKVAEHKLQPGDKITIGAAVIWYEKKNVAVERPAAAAPKPPTGDVRRPAGATPAAGTPAVQPATRRVVAAKIVAAEATAAAPAADAARAELLRDFSFRGRGGGSWGKIIAAAVVLVAIGAGAYYARGLFSSGPVKEEELGNLVQNGSFEGLGAGRPANWQVRASTVLGPAERPASSVTIDASQGRNGGGCLVLEKSGSAGDLAAEAAYSEQIPLGKGTQVRAEAWTRSDGFGGRVQLKVEWLRGVNGIIVAEEYSDPAVMGASAWTKMGATFAPPAGAGAARVALAAVGRAGRVYFDDVLIRLEGAPAPPKEKKLGNHRVAASRQGIVSVGLRGRASLSNIGVRLENDKDGTTSQAFASDVQSSEDENSLTFTGKMLNPSDLREIEFEGRVESVQGGTTVYYVFKPEALRQVDRVTIVMTVPRDSVQGVPERAEDSASRLSFPTDEGDVVVEYPRDMARIRTKKLEGRLRVAQSFPVDSSSTDELAFGLKIRDAAAGAGSNDPAREAEELRKKGRLGTALSVLQGLVKTVREAAAKERMEADIKSLEETERRDWADAQAQAFQARLTRRADQVSRANGAIDRYLETWSGEGREGKANQLRTDLQKELAGSADADSERPRRILERAKKWAELGKRSLAQSMLQTLVTRYPQSDVAPEAQELLRKVGQ